MHEGGAGVPQPPSQSLGGDPQLFCTATESRGSCEKIRTKKKQFLDAISVVISELELLLSNIHYGKDVSTLITNQMDLIKRGGDTTRYERQEDNEDPDYLYDILYRDILYFKMNHYYKHLVDGFQDDPLRAGSR